MSDEEDPEVIADLKLRDASERDATRTRGAGVYDWRAPRTVATWKCRLCGCDVPVPAESVEAKTVFDRILQARGESPLYVDEIMLCARCHRFEERNRARSNATNRETLAAVIREYKALMAASVPNAPLETKLETQMRALGHEHVSELRELCEQRRTARHGRGGTRA